MMEETDAALVTRAREGDPQAFGGLVERHSARLFQLAFRMTGNEHDAEDVVQESFLRAYRQIDRFESRAVFATWLHRIAVNCSVDLLRRRRRRDDPLAPLEPDLLESGASLSAPAASPDARAYQVEVRQKVEAAMNELTPTERTALVLRPFEGQAIDEIGRVLGAGQSATKQSIFRAVQKMRRSLEPVVSVLS